MNNQNEIFKEYPDILNIDELCKMLQIQKNYAFRLLREGYIYSKKIGKKYLIAKNDVINFFYAGDYK